MASVEVFGTLRGAQHNHIHSRETNSKQGNIVLQTPHASRLLQLNDQLDRLRQTPFNTELQQRGCT